MSLHWVSLCWMLLCWMLWRHGRNLKCYFCSFLNLSICNHFKGKSWSISSIKNSSEQWSIYFLNFWNVLTNRRTNQGSFLKLYSNILTQSPIPLLNPVLPHLVLFFQFFWSSILPGSPLDSPAQHSSICKPSDCQSPHQLCAGFINSTNYFT